MTSLFVPFARSQEYIVTARHYSVPEGLSHRFVRNVIQDQQGFIWAATHEGINRFDGYDFKQFTKQKGLRAASCVQILEDRRGQLWLFYTPKSTEEDTLENFNPIDIFDPVSGSVTTFKEKFNATQLTSHIIEIKPGYQNDIHLILQSGEIYRYDGFKLQRLPFKSYSGPCHMAVNEQGVIGLLCQDSVTLLDSIGKVIYRTSIPKACEFIRVADGRFWVGKHLQGEDPVMWSIRAGESAQPFNLYDSNGLPIQFEWDPNFAAPVFPDRLGRWWVYFNGRLLLFESAGKFLYDFSADLKSFSLRNPTQFIFDRHNTVWIGSVYGLLCVTMQENPFQNFLPSRGLIDTRGILEDKNGEIYVVQQGNTYKLDLDSGIAKNLQIPAWTGAIEDELGRLWFGDYGFKVHFYDPISGDKKIYFPTRGGSEDQRTSTFALYVDASTNRIWVGTKGRGLAYIDTLKQSISLFTKYNEFEHLRKASITCFLKGDKGIWIGTEIGLYFLESGKGITQEYSRRTGSLPFDDISHIYQDSDGIFWLATHQGGLIRWEKESGNFRQFTQRNGLSNDVIHAVYEDAAEQLWLTSNYGLMRFDKHNFQVKTYLPRDGIPHEEFNYGSHHQAADGRLFFGGLNGVTSFYPQQLYVEKQKGSPSLAISEYLELDGSSGAFIDKTQEMLTANRIELDPQNKSFQLKIAFPDYQSPSDNHFAYRIEGLYSDWNYQSDNTIRVNSLPYGSYTLQVKAEGASGHWSAQELNLPLTILRPFYLRGWFITVCSIILIAIVWWQIARLKHAAQKLEDLVKKRTLTIEQDKEIIEKQAAELLELDELKSRFFTNVAHELRTPLTLIQGPLQLVLEKTGLDKNTTAMLQLAQGNTSILLRLVEELLDLKKLDAGKLHLEEEIVEFYPLMNRLVSSFESFAQANDIKLSFHYPLGQSLRLRLDPNKFERIIYNLLSNAIKFTRADGLVEVRTEDLGTQMCISVTDSGLGIHPDDLPYVFDRFYQAKTAHFDTETHSIDPVDQTFALPIDDLNCKSREVLGGAGIGLAISREYAALMQGALRVKSQVDIGSTFFFEFPKKEVPTTETKLGEKDLSNLASHASASKQNASPLSALQIAERKQERSKETIFIAEDNPDMRLYLSEILKTQYDIVTAANGRLLLEILSKKTIEAEVQNPALIITDIMMPEMDGFELIRRLKSSPQWQGIPVIALTARVGLDDRISALRFGVDDYLAKPFEPTELLARGANLIHNYRQRREWLAAQQSTSEEDTYFFKIAPPKAIPSAEQVWLSELENLAMNKIGSVEFSVTDLAHLLHLSERHLRRKLKELIGISPSEYLKEIRLQRARQLLENGTYETVAELSYAIGLSTPKHFSRIFKARFGKLPSSYL